MPRQEKEFHILIGKSKNGEYVFLDDAFKYDDGSLQGLTGTCMLFHTEDEYEEAKENYVNSGDLLYLRKEAVKAGKTEESYEDRAEEVIENDECLVYDDSYRCKWRIDDALEIIDKHEFEETGIHATSEFSDCIGGGRCFHKEMLELDYWIRIEKKNFEIFKKLYIEYEKPNDDRNIIDKAKKRLKELYVMGCFETDIAKESRTMLENNPEYAEKFLETFGERNFDKNLDFDKL